MHNPNLNGARRGPGSDLSISLKLAPSADSIISFGILLKYVIHSFQGTRVRGVNSVEACVSGTSRPRLNTLTHRRNYGKAQVCKFLDKTLSIWKSCERGAKLANLFEPCVFFKSRIQVWGWLQLINYDQAQICKFPQGFC